MRYARATLSGGGLLIALHKEFEVCSNVGVELSVTVVVCTTLFYRWPSVLGSYIFGAPFLFEWMGARALVKTRLTYGHTCSKDVSTFSAGKQG